jgi:hypothetical protein
MLEELERRNYSQSTARAYLMTIKDFVRYYIAYSPNFPALFSRNRPPSRM